MSAANNPFTSLLPPGFPNGRDVEECDAIDVLRYAAESFWDYLDRLPSGGDAERAKHRLEEAVFWGEKATNIARLPGCAADGGGTGDGVTGGR